VAKPRWLEIITEGYLKDPKAQLLLHELSLHSPNERGYALRQGIIRFKDRIWLGNNLEAHQAILLSLHSGGVGGHSGFLGTYERTKALFVWPNIKVHVNAYVQQCQTCQQAKGEHVKLPGLLNPLPVPT
jgi:hypothetical protein